MMHELGHIILKTTDDDAADRFASSILAPSAMVLCKELKTADQISKYFDISFAAANRSLLRPGEIPILNKDCLKIAEYFYAIEDQAEQAAIQREELKKRLKFKRNRRRLQMESEACSSFFQSMYDSDPVAYESMVLGMHEW